MPVAERSKLEKVRLTPRTGTELRTDRDTLLDGEPFDRVDGEHAA